MPATPTSSVPTDPSGDGRPEPTPASSALHQRLIAQGLRPVGCATARTVDIRAAMSAAPLFAELTDAEADRLAAFFFVYDAPAGVTVIAEGEVGDFMLLLMSGAIEIVRGGPPGRGARLSIARAGQSLGEMSMFDGEPRFSSCVTLEPSRIAVLGRDAMMQVMDEAPRLGGRLMLRLVHLLSERLRRTSAQLVTRVETARQA